VGERGRWQNSEEMRVYEEVDSIIDVQLYNNNRGEYVVQLSSGCRLAVNLTNVTYSCQWLQIRGYSCKHVMVVVKEEKK